MKVIFRLAQLLFFCEQKMREKLAQLKVNLYLCIAFEK